MPEQETQQPTAGVGGDATGGSKPVDQETVNRLEKKWRKDKEASDARAQAAEERLAQIEAEKKTEAEKAIEAAATKARTETEREWGERLKKQEIGHALREQIQAKGLDPDLAFVVLAKTKIDSVDDIAGAITEALGDRFKPGETPPEPKPPGQSGMPTAPSQSSMPTTPERMAAYIEAYGPRAVTPAMWDSYYRMNPR